MDPAIAPHYIPAEALNHNDISDKASGDAPSHHFQRAHRGNGELELGFTEILEGRNDAGRHVVTSAGLSEWSGRQRWEAVRPDWLPALAAEFFGVFIYCIAGFMAATTLTITTLAGSPQGNLTMVGLAYSLGVTFAIICCATSSGGHFNPSLTIAQVIFKGFPIFKAPFYILAQILGAVVAGLVVMACYQHELFQLTDLLRAHGKGFEVFTPIGPAGTMALFPNPGRSYGSIFATEFFADVFIAIVIWANLDPANPFTSPQAAPYTIGLSFGVIIWGFATGDVATNTARDVGARLVCGMFWGIECFPAKYSAIAALTNIPATLVGVSIYTFFLSDTRRPVATVHLKQLEDHAHRLVERATTTHAEILDAKIALTISKGGDTTYLEKKRTNLTLRNL